MVVDKPDAVLACLRSNHHDNTDVILVGYRLDNIDVILERQVGDNRSADTAFDTTLEVVLYSVVHDRVQIAHDYERNAHLVLDSLEL